MYAKLMKERIEGARQISKRCNPITIIPNLIHRDTASYIQEAETRSRDSRTRTPKASVYERDARVTVFPRTTLPLLSVPANSKCSYATRSHSNPGLS